MQKQIEEMEKKLKEIQTTQHERTGDQVISLFLIHKTKAYWHKFKLYKSIEDKSPPSPI